MLGMEGPGHQCLVNAHYDHTRPHTHGVARVTRNSVWQELCAAAVLVVGAVAAVC